MYKEFIYYETQIYVYIYLYTYMYINILYIHKYLSDRTHNIQCIYSYNQDVIDICLRCNDTLKSVWRNVRDRLRNFQVLNHKGVYIHIYVYTYVYIFICIYTCIYIWRINKDRLSISQVLNHKGV
jgi:hypothetical protein